MPRRDSLKEALARLSQVRMDPSSASSQDELRRVLSRESSHAVAKAARIVGEAGLETSRHCQSGGAAPGREARLSPQVAGGDVRTLGAPRGQLHTEIAPRAAVATLAMVAGEM